MAEPIDGPDTIAVRVALWRALHVEIDAAPHVFEDEIGLRLAAPDGDWRHRGDMDPVRTSPDLERRRAVGGDDVMGPSPTA